MTQWDVVEVTPLDNDKALVSIKKLVDYNDHNWRNDEVWGREWCIDLSNDTEVANAIREALSYLTKETP